MRSKKFNQHWLLVVLLVVLLDQASKYFFNMYLPYDQAVGLLPFFALTLRYNPGAAFSFLGNQSGWQVYLLVLISLLAVLVLSIWLLRLPRQQRLNSLALSLIIGGALGNLIDRLRFGYVVDFFDFHLGTWHFATFNVADAAVCVGAFLLVVCMLFSRR